MQDTYFSCFLPFSKGRRHDLFQNRPCVDRNIDLKMGRQHHEDEWKYDALGLIFWSQCSLV